MLNRFYFSCLSKYHNIDRLQRVAAFSIKLGNAHASKSPSRAQVSSCFPKTWLVYQHLLTALCALGVYIYRHLSCMLLKRHWWMLEIIQTAMNVFISAFATYSKIKTPYVASLLCINKCGHHCVSRQSLLWSTQQKAWGRTLGSSK